MTPWLSCRILTTSRIHLVVLSDSRAMIVASFQLMTWFSWLTSRPLAEDSKRQLSKLHWKFSELFTVILEVKCLILMFTSTDEFIQEGCVCVMTCECCAFGVHDLLVVIWLYRSCSTVHCLSADFSWSMCLWNHLHHQNRALLRNGWRWSQE